MITDQTAARPALGYFAPVGFGINSYATPYDKQPRSGAAHASSPEQL